MGASTTEPVPNVVMSTLALQNEVSTYFHANGKGYIRHKIYGLSIYLSAFTTLLIHAFFFKVF